MPKPSKMSAELILAEAISELQEVVSVWARMMANLDDALPGFPSSTPGASPGSGHVPPSDPDEARLLPVERMATEPDRARRDLDEVLRLSAWIGQSAQQLYSLGRTWGFVRHQGRPDIEASVADGWCECHQRVGITEPIDEGRYARVCRWCGDFHASEGRWPSADLLLARQHGQRITRAMIEADHPARKVRSGRKGARRSAA